VGFVGQRPEHFPHEPRLADAGLACEQYHLALAVACLPPAAQQQRDLLLAADKGREARSLTRLKATLRAAFSSDPPRHDRLGEALEPLWAEISELEQPTDQPAPRLTDHQVPLVRRAPEGGRRGWGLADHRLLARRPLADPDDACRDPRTRPEVERNYSRAWTLCDQLGRSAELFPVLRGLWNYHLVRGELQRAHDLSARLVTLAEEQGTPVRRALARRARGTTLVLLGRFADAEAALKEGIAIDDAVAEWEDPAHLLLYTERAGVVPTTFGVGLLVPRLPRPCPGQYRSRAGARPTAHARP
jgi:hypothetical protein